MSESKFGIFDEFARQARDFFGPKFPLEMRFVMECLAHGRRFYLPGDFELFGESQAKRGAPSNVAAENLPYPALALLSEVPITVKEGVPGPPYRDDYVPNLTCAVEFANEVHMIAATLIRDDKGARRASFLPPVRFALPLHFYSELACLDTKLTHELFAAARRCGVTPEEFGKDYGPDKDRLLNLCQLLQLSNVHAERVDPPEKLNRKRERNGNLPLYSYHVLNVDGDRWHSRATGDGPGKRSHMRRGHIRRISEERAIWVRAHLVHGSRPGFVGKDYDTTALANRHRSEVTP